MPCAVRPAKQEQRRGDRPGKAAVGGIVEIGDVGFQHLFVPCVEREPPQGIVGRETGCEYGGCEIVIVAEGRGEIRTERDAGGTSQRSEVDDQRGVTFTSLGQGIAEDQSPLGIGVGDFDGQALAAGEYVAGAEGIAGNRIFDGGDKQVQPDREPRGHDQPGKRKGMGRAAHVLLHQAHSRRRLDVEAAAVETDALSHDGEARVRGIAPFQLDQSRREIAGCC